MKAKGIFALIFGVAALVGVIALLRPRTQPLNSDSVQLDTNLSARTAESLPQPSIPEAVPEPGSIVSPAIGRPIRHARAEPIAVTNKLERLTQIRETFRALAA